jgi:class 3 adenylate cyclase
VVAATCGVEKIKTIGDSYMAVAGAPESQTDHASAAMALALGMLAALDELRQGASVPLELRIGLASGSAVGGVIGQQRILFDLWGDTVNIAKRMESTGVAGRIHVASTTHQLLRDSWSFEERAPMEIKGFGHMTTYLLLNPPR